MIIGPSKNKSNEIKLTLPSCIKTQSPQDEQELKEFINAIVVATNNDCLDKFALLMEQQNKAIQEFVKKIDSKNK